MICNKPVVYDDDRWATIITEAEIDCVNYVKNNTDLQTGFLLDIGIGASYCYLELNKYFSQIDGITVMKSEIDIADKIPENCSYGTFNANKYNTEQLAEILDKRYKVIIDVNLKMFGCCQQHWEEFFKFIVKQLAPGGVLLTHTAGFGCYEDKNKKINCGELTLKEINDLIDFVGKLSLSVINSNLINGHSLVVIKNVA